MTDESIAGRISLAGRTLSTRIERGLAPYGISRGEYRVLFGLYGEEGLTQTTFAERHQLDKSVIARAVGRLEEKGYVERRTDPEDRRRKLLYLTPDAEALRSEVRELQSNVEAELTRGLTEAETDAMADALNIAIENLRAANGDER